MRDNEKSPVRDDEESCFVELAGQRERCPKTGPRAVLGQLLSQRACSWLES